MMEGNFYALISLLLIAAYGNSTGVLLLIGFGALRKWEAIEELAALYINPAVVIHVFKGISVLFVVFQVVRYIRGLLRQSTTPDNSLLKPLFFPCTTKHVRLTPKPHSFVYSYLWVGIPVPWKGSSGGMISADDCKQRSWFLSMFSLTPENAWYTVNGDDYLGRGEGTLSQKLQDYLRTQVSPQFLHISSY